MNKRLTMLVVVLLFGNLFCLAQTDRENPKPSGLAVEIVFRKDAPPAYLSVPATEKGKSWSWFASFGRVADWQQPADSLPVRAVNFVVRREGKDVKVDVSVFTGHRFHEKEEFVTTLTMHENDKIIIKDLLKFGVEPFEIGVVKVTPMATVLPSVKINSKLLTVVSIEPNYSTLPSYKLTLANNSDKAVSAFTFEITINGKRMISGMPQGGEGNVLIEPGGILEKEFPNANQNVKVSDGQALPVQPNQLLTISTIIYKDGTFEGDQSNALRFLAFEAGRKMQIKRIIALLRTNEKKSNYAEIIKQAENLSTAIDEAIFSKFVAALSNLPDTEKSQLRGPAEIASQGTKTRFIDELKTAAKENSEMTSSKNWLAFNLERYRNWLARLD